MNSYEKWQEMIEDDTFWKKKERNRNAKKAQEKRNKNAKVNVNTS